MDRLLAIDDDRGRLAGLGAVLLALFIFLLLTRMDWSAGVDLIVSGLAAAAVLGPAWALPPKDGDAPPPGWLSAFLAAGFVLEFGFLVSLADVLGANPDDISSGTVVWISLLLAVVFGALSQRRNSAVCTLLSAIAFVVMIVAGIDWIFSPDTATTFRWVLLILGLLLFAAGYGLYGSRGRHGTVLVVVSGLSIVAIAVTYIGLAFNPLSGGEGPDNITAWWEIVTLVFGLAVAAFSVHTREPGPGYVAALLLFAFAALANTGVEDKFLGWPLVLLILTGAVIAAFMRGVGPSPGVAAADTTREVRL